MSPSHIIVTISNTYHVTCDPADTPITALCNKYSVRVTRGKMVTGDLLMGAKPISVLEVCQTASSRSFHTLHVFWLSHLFEFSFSQLRASTSKPMGAKLAKVVNLPIQFILFWVSSWSLNGNYSLHRHNIWTSSTITRQLWGLHLHSQGLIRTDMGSSPFIITDNQTQKLEDCLCT